MNGEEEKAREEQPTIGRILEQARQEKQLSLEEVQQAIKIHVRHLRALEQGRFDQLPSPTWGRGFLTMYANYLGLDHQALGLDARALAQSPVRRRSPRPIRYLLRRWPWVAALNVIVLAAASAVGVVIAPYNAFTDSVTGFVSRLAPEQFLDNSSQRVLVLGYSEDEYLQTDNVMLIKVARAHFGLLAIPHSTLTAIPGGHGRGSVGRAFTIGGSELTRRTVAQLTGTEVPHHLAVDASGLDEIVDSMGGVRVDVDEPISDQSSISGSEINLTTGPQKLDGDQALVYYLGNDGWNDAERAKHQLNFLYDVYYQAFSPINLLSNPKTLNAVDEHTDTDLNIIQMIQLISRVQALKSSGVPMERGTIPGREGFVDDQNDSTQSPYWIPNAQKMSTVLDKTVR